jgi:hypothetical protein
VPVQAASESSPAEPIRLVTFDEKALDASSMSYELTRSFMTKEQWDEQVAAFRKKFEDWEKDNEGDVGRYLNDRFLLVALGAISGEVEKIKRALVWLALYKEFNQQVPGVVTVAVTKHRESLTRLFRDFTWDKASLYIKNKEWRKDTNHKTETAVVSNDKKGG